MSGLRKYLIACGLLLVAYVTAQYFKPKPTDWTPTYLSEDKIPYGTFLLKNRLGDLFPKATVIKVNDNINENLKQAPAGKSNYIIIGSELKIDTVDFNEMTRYMQKGNNILMAGINVSEVLKKKLKLNLSADLDFMSGRKHPINFVNPTLKRDLDYYFDKGIGDQYFSEFDKGKATVLGLRDQKDANFLKYTFGKGALYILPNPQLLTNYTVLKEPGLDYASKVLSYLPLTSTVIWDEHLAKPLVKDQSVLRVLFQYDQLRWAYYLALFSLVVFILFEVKRRQRIIPVIDTLKNTSVEFAQTVGRVYYQQRDNQDITKKKVSYFLEYLRSKYRMRTIEIDDEFRQSVLKLTSATAETIDELLENIVLLAGKEKVSDGQLIKLNQLLEKFYNQDR